MTGCPALGAAREAERVARAQAIDECARVVECMVAGGAAPEHAFSALLAAGDRIRALAGPAKEGKP